MTDVEQALKDLEDLVEKIRKAIADSRAHEWLATAGDLVEAARGVERVMNDLSKDRGNIGGRKMFH